jgi:hypothetical protein
MIEFSPDGSEARVMALASVTREEVKLLRAEQIHEQPYHRAVTALLKARQQSAGALAAAARQRDESWLLGHPIGYLTLGVRKPPHAECEVHPPPPLTQRGDRVPSGCPIS